MHSLLPDGHAEASGVGSLSRAALISPRPVIVDRCMAARGSPARGWLLRRYMVAAVTAACGVFGSTLPRVSTVMQPKSRSFAASTRSCSVRWASRDCLLLAMYSLHLEEDPPWEESPAHRRLDSSAAFLRASSCAIICSWRLYSSFRSQW